jgi:hypothetical protein
LCTGFVQSKAPGQRKYENPPFPAALVRRGIGRLLLSSKTAMPKNWRMSISRMSRRSAAELLTRDEARRIAVNFAKLPELLHKPSSDQWIEKR